MNIFVLDKNPTRAAQMHCDKHVVKMSIEYAQLLSTAHHLLARGDETYLSHIYKATHSKHPATLWVAAHPAHYAWTLNLAEATWAEYTYRYGKIHASSRLQPWLSKVPRDILALGPITPPPQCMPVQYHVLSESRDPWNWQHTITAYQQYYCYEKSRFATWTKRCTPDWFVVPTMTTTSAVSFSVQI